MGGKGGICGREIQYNAEISRRIEQLRREREVASGELARAAGVSAPMLNNYRVGLTRWPAFRLRLIADYLGVPVYHILPGAKSYVKKPCKTGKLF